MQRPEKMKLGQAGREPATRADEAETGVMRCSPRRAGVSLPPRAAGPGPPPGPPEGALTPDFGFPAPEGAGLYCLEPPSLWEFGGSPSRRCQTAFTACGPRCSCLCPHPLPLAWGSGAGAPCPGLGSGDPCGSFGARADGPCSLLHLNGNTEAIHCLALQFPICPSGDPLPWAGTGMVGCWAWAAVGRQHLFAMSSVHRGRYMPRCDRAMSSRWAALGSPDKLSIGRLLQSLAIWLYFAVIAGRCSW